MEDTIPAKIISEMPLPIPRSVISSPIQTRKMVPAVSEMMMARVSTLSPMPSTTPACRSSCICPKPCARAMGTVSQCTIRLIF